MAAGPGQARHWSKRRIATAAAALASLIAAPLRQAFAVDLYWDLNGATSGASSGTTAAGTWGTANGNWTTDPSGNSSSANWTSGATAVFAAGTNATGAYTVTPASSQTITAAGIRVEEGTVTLANTVGTTLTAPAWGEFKVDVASGATLNLNQQLKAYPVTKEGLGTLTFGSSILIPPGPPVATITLNRGTILNGAPGTVFSSANTTMRFDAGIGQTLSNSQIISGSGGLSKTGSGTYAINGILQYSGATSVSGGTLQLDGGGGPAVIQSATAVSVSPGATLELLNNASPEVGSLSGSFSSAALKLTSGTLSVGSNHSSTTFAGAISGGGRLVKVGTGTLTLTGSNTYSGGTSINGGTLSINDDAQLGFGGDVTFSGGILNPTAMTILNRSLTMNAGGGTVDFGFSFGLVTVNGNVGGTGAFNMAGFGFLNLPSANTLSGAVVIDSAFVSLSSGSGSLTNASLITVKNGGELSMSNSSGVKTTRVGGGGVSLANGTLSLSGHASVAMTQNVAASISGHSNFTVSSPGASTTLALGTPTRGNRGTALFRGMNANARISASGTLVGGGGAAGTSTIDILPWGVADASSSGNGTDFATIEAGLVRPLAAGEYAALVSGSATLDNVSVASAVGLSADTTANAVRLTGTGTLVTIDPGRTLTVNSGAILSTAAGANEIAGGAINFASEGIVIVKSGGTTTVSGVISGASGVTKSGAGTLSLSGVNAYGGQTTVDAGVLAVSADENLGGAATPLVLNGGTLQTTASLTLNASRGVTVASVATNAIDVPSAVVTTVAGVVSGAGSLAKTGTGTLVLANVNTHSGGTEVNGGTLLIDADNKLGAAGAPLRVGFATVATTASFSTARPITLNSSATFDVAAATAVTLSGAISGQNALFKTGAGTLVLSGNNIFNGSTNINGGIVRASAESNLGAPGNSIRLGGGTLNVTGSLISTRPINVNAASTIDVNSGAALITSGSASGAGDLTKAGAGSLSVGGGGSFGNVTIAAGSFTSAAGTLTLASLNNQGTFTVSGGTLTANAVTNLSSGTLSGGMWRVVSPGTLSFGASTVTANAATVTLDGASSGFAALNAMTSNTGTFTVTNSRWFSAAAGFNNSSTGTINVSSGGVISFSTGQNNGIIDSQPGGTANFTADFSHNVGSTLKGSGAVFFTGGVQQFDGTLLGEIDLNLTGATATFGSTFDSPVSVVNLSSGVMTYAAGARLTVGAGGINFSGSQSPTLGLGSGAIPARIVLNGDVSVFSNTTGLKQILSNGSGAVDGTVDLNGAERTFNIAQGLATPDLLVTARIINGSVRKSGTGTLALTAANTYAGGTTLASGALEISDSAALGSGAVTFSGGTLNLRSNAAVATFTNNLVVAASNSMSINIGRISAGSPNTFVLNATTLGAALNVSGTGTLRFPGATLAHDLSISNFATLEFTGAIGGGFAITQGSGRGTTIFSGSAPNTYTGLTTINVGTLQLAKAAGVNAIAGDLSVFTGGTVRWINSNQVADSATLTINGSSSTADLNGKDETVAALSMTGGTLSLDAGAMVVTGGITANNSTATASISGSGLMTAASLNVQGNLSRSGGVTKITGSTLTVAAGKKLDLGDSKLITAAPLASVQGQIAAGRNAGNWDGSGIITSMSAASAASMLTTLAVANAGAINKTSLGGVSVLTSDTLVTYTYCGDANLDGTVNGDDFVRIDTGYFEHRTDYADGDFNYSGNIDADDYWLIDRNYSRQGGSFASGATAGMAAVPEPVGVTWGVGLLALGRRRRRV
jgi:fibronectin-binding autotransporter adhesin